MLKKIFGFLLVTCLLLANEQKPLQELIVEASSQIKIGDSVLDYKTFAGTLILKDEQGNDKGSIFYTAYFLKNQPGVERPLTFCFNGGPGAGSVWLNLGFLGPKVLDYEDLDYANPPYRLVDNSETLLDETDLVFVDPIPSGYSLTAPGQDIKQFLGTEEDANAMCDFVRLFVSKYKRWDSPKYLIGESYGGLRVSKMAFKLHDTYGLYLNGLILISPALDFTTIVPDQLNDLPYVLALPTYAAANWFHQKNSASLDSLLKESETYALNEYALALMRGDQLDQRKKDEIALQLQKMTGIKASEFVCNDLRLDPAQFTKALLADKEEVIGRFDARKTGFVINCGSPTAGYDPSLESIYGAMTAAFTQYLLKDLKWPEQREYKALSSHISSSWNWGKPNCFASCLGDLKKLLIQNPKMHLFAAVGIYDLATPYFATEYSLFHFNGHQTLTDRIHMHRYEAGHMMYLNQEIKVKLKKDLQKIYHSVKK